MQTYSQRYPDGQSYAMGAIMLLRDEEPVFVAADNKGNELWRFPSDNTLVVETNTGVVCEGDRGWEDLVASFEESA